MQRLAHGHLDLLGAVPAPAASRIERTGSVTRMPSRDTTSDGSRGFVVVLQGYALKPPDPTIVAIDQQMDGVRNDIRQVVEVERALVGDDGSLGADRKALHSHLLMARTRIATKTVQTATNVLVSPGANMVMAHLSFSNRPAPISATSCQKWLTPRSSRRIRVRRRSERSLQTYW